MPSTGVLRRVALVRTYVSEECNLFPVRYELGFYIPEDDIRQRHSPENLKYYNIFCVLHLSILFLSYVTERHAYSDC
jgi:hypothetical protein